MDVLGIDTTPWLKYIHVTCGESVLVALKSTFDTNAEAGSTYSISNTPNEPTLPTYSKLRETNPNPNFKWLHKVTPTQNPKKIRSDFR